MILLAVPVIGTSFLQLSYNFLDMLWVGRLGSEAVAAIGVSGLLINILTALQMIGVVGTGIIVAHAIGEKNSQKQLLSLNAGFRLNLFAGIILASALFLLGRPFLTFMAIGNPLVEKMALQYLLPFSGALFLTFFNLWYARVYNSFGLNSRAFRINAAGFLLNMLLDPLLIYVLGWGVFGAGSATLLANLLIALLFFFDAKSIFFVDFNVRIPPVFYFDMIRLGFPNAVQRILFSFINILIGTMVAAFGAEAVAAQKIGAQVESITFLIIGGLNAAVISFVGQNFGSKKPDRIRSGIGVAIRLGGIYSLITSTLFLLFPRQLAGIFVQDTQTVSIAASYLRIIGLTQVFMSVEIVFNGLFIGMGLPKIPAAISIGGTLLRIPLAWFLIQHLGIQGIWWSISLSMLLRGSLSIIAYLRQRKNLLATDAI